MLSFFSVSNRMKFSFWGFPTHSVLTLIQMRLKVFLNCFSFHLIGRYYIFLLFSISRCVLALISSHFKVFFSFKFHPAKLFYPLIIFFYCLPSLLYYNGIRHYSPVHFIHGYIHDLIVQLFLRIQTEKLFFILNIS